MQIQPNLFFDGCCEEARECFRQALGAEVTMLQRYKDAAEARRLFAALGQAARCRGH